MRPKLRWACNTGVPLLLDCHCEASRVRDGDAIQRDRHGALRAPCDDNHPKIGGWLV